MATEREIKVLAEPSLALEDPSGVVPGLRVGEPVVRSLRAAYYDTPTLALARAGASLRHRTGEASATWTVKLPLMVDPLAMVRSELSFAGGRTKVPPAALGLLRGLVRSQEVAVAARLATERIETPIFIGERHVATMVDDRVKVTTPGSPRSTFREIEVELVDEADQRVLEDLHAWLVDQGCTDERPLRSKVSRALGPAALEPADGAAPPAGRRSSVADFVRALLAGSVQQLLSHHAGVVLGTDDEAVHRFRVAARRLRSDLRTFRPLLDAARSRSLADDLGWLGHEVGVVRDLDVLIERLRSQEEQLTPADASTIEPVVADLARQRADAHAHVYESLGSDRYVALLDALVAAVDDPPLTDEARAAGPRSARSVVVRLVRKPWRRLAAAATAIGPDSPDGELHACRILAKRARYAAEAVVAIHGRDARRFARRMADLQTVLGDHQDAVIAEHWLRDAAGRWPDATLAIGQLIAIERAHQQRTRADVAGVWARAHRRELHVWLDA